MFIQRDSGGLVNDSIGHGEKQRQKTYEHVPNNERLSRQSCWNLEIQEHS